MRDQHREMLKALHKEVEELKKKNKGAMHVVAWPENLDRFSPLFVPDLQFQLAMQGLSESSSSSVEWRLIRGTPEQIEALEGNVKQLQAELHEARLGQCKFDCTGRKSALVSRSRNLYLSNLVAEQKSRLLDLDRTPSTPSDISDEEQEVINVARAASARLQEKVKLELNLLLWT